MNVISVVPGSSVGMIDAQSIALFFGTAAAIWVVGFGWGKCVAWLRALRTAA